ncbi:ADP-glyceromanno-heptose 6-epimerase [Acetobacter sp. TBRC 12305]|uniref:ADP-L-glycero-D-manno-heptose-6-epimerase n=1 Tax=Acetobacter garciniae TaxID=2817435 RepID=A0A939HNT6_9PROT|nr:ADP-glyceromanno-heptose 6-epimerase [Acetobacter garciniae]MBO1325214.1 ADP-glyceromanno-heptose 6-epimerase [Acetobacter garciniae]MBX0344815.1 ADP-glyceromanno-heptose 6-epimerase [Acetobacter garciniae]
MIIITGGAGFIGSCLQAALAARGLDTVIVDWLGTEGKWRNIAAHPPTRLVTPDELPAFLESLPGAQAVFHMGAISETTARDGDLVWRTNVALSQDLWQWCARTQTRFIYASSAATYGGADRPELFSDDPARLDTLVPLNLYGWSKHVFDRYAVNTAQAGAPCPPQWAGLKFFNVFGPNEYHKGKMISVVKVKYDELRAGGPVRLFRSDKPGLSDGMQARDFIWVGDVVNMLLWLFDTPSVSGLFNCGTGRARRYLDVAYAVCDALGVARDVEFVDMPPSLRGQYQSYTQADLTRLRAAGYKGEFTPLEEGVTRYVQEYLTNGRLYL